MKITTFNPQIITKDPEAVIALFEALGFERAHNKIGGEDLPFSSIRMRMPREDGTSFHVDVVESQSAPQVSDMTMIRMNVDDFDEAKKLLESHGFTASSQGNATDSSSKSIGMYSPSGFSFSLVEHIKH